MADGEPAAGFGSLTLDHTLRSVGRRLASDYNDVQWPRKSLLDLHLPVKLSSIPVRSAAGCWCLAMFIATLTACAVPPSQAVVDRLDPDTATTVTVIRNPVELVVAAVHGPVATPFAFLAPFETDRMGTRSLYLWMSAPSVDGARLQPKLLCDGQPLALAPLDSDVSHIGLSHPPYVAPVPWNMQWYFQLPREALNCLAGAQKVALETHVADNDAEQFTVDSKGLSELRAFSSH
jgi:hypothetical protein